MVCQLVGLLGVLDVAVVDLGWFLLYDLLFQYLVEHIIDSQCCDCGFGCFGFVGCCFWFCFGCSLSFGLVFSFRFGHSVKFFHHIYLLLYLLLSRYWYLYLLVWTISLLFSIYFMLLLLVLLLLSSIYFMLLLLLSMMWQCLCCQMWHR